MFTQVSNGLRCLAGPAEGTTSARSPQAAGREVLRHESGGQLRCHLAWSRADRGELKSFVMDRPNSLGHVVTKRSGVAGRSVDRPHTDHRCGLEPGGGDDESRGREVQGRQRFEHAFELASQMVLVQQSSNGAAGKRHPRRSLTGPRDHQAGAGAMSGAGDASFAGVTVRGQRLDPGEEPVPTAVIRQYGLECADVPHLQSRVVAHEREMELDRLGAALVRQHVVEVGTPDDLHGRRRTLPP